MSQEDISIQQTATPSPIFVSLTGPLPGVDSFYIQ